MERVEHWELRLAAEIEAARHRPFVWGQHDCCLWAGQVRGSLTGIDDTADWRGTYSDERGAYRVRRARGFRSIEQIARRYMGRPLQTVLLAQRGDVALASVITGGARALPALGVVIGRDVAFTGAEGLVFVPLRACRLAWPVGRSGAPSAGRGA